MEGFVLHERNYEGALTARKQAPHTSGDETESRRTLALIQHRLDEDKAEDIVTIDLHGKTAMADYMVIASGRSTRQVSALTDKLMEALKEVTGKSPRVEGKNAGDWVLLDAGDVIVHIFRPEVREFYQIEKMWMTDPAQSPARMV